MALEPIEDIGERQADFAGRQGVTSDFVERVGIGERFLATRIDDPDISHAE